MNVHSESYLLRLLTCIFICTLQHRSPKMETGHGEQSAMRLSAHRESQNISIVPPPSDPAHSSRYAASHACMQSCSVTTALQNSLNAVRWDNSQQHHIPNKYCASSCNVPTLPSSSDAPPFRPEEIGSLISNPFLYCKNFQYPGSISNPDKNVEIASSVLLEGAALQAKKMTCM